MSGRFNAQLLGLEQIKEGRGIVLREYTYQDTLPINERLRLMNEQYLKLAVCCVDKVSRKSECSGNGGGVTNCTENVLSLVVKLAIGKLKMIRLELRQILDRIKYICRVPENILKVLRSRVGKPRESAEGRDLRKVIVAELTDVDLSRAAVCNVHRRRQHIRGNALT